MVATTAGWRARVSDESSGERAEMWGAESVDSRPDERVVLRSEERLGSKLVERLDSTWADELSRSVGGG